MACSVRQSIIHKVSQSLKNFKGDRVPKESLSNALQINPNSIKSRIEYQIPLQTLVGQVDNEQAYQKGSEILKSFETDSTVNGVALSPPGSKNPQLHLHLSIGAFAQSLLEDILTTSEDKYVSSKLLSASYSEPIVVEFSSPNIAKPFHVGHLRSTIHGNYISNLHKAMGHNVKRLNYLGDWGTQFGLLQYGLEQQWHSWEEISKKPIQLLLEIYIRANALAEKDEQVAATARKLFQKLESGDEELMKPWAQIRTYTVSELRKMYERLGVQFDEFHWESQYSIKDLRNVLANLEEKGYLIRTAEGKQIVRLNDERSVTLVKSDGSSLYLTRDIAAAIDRYQRFGFNRMFYVVDNAQTDHFNSLKSLLKMMGHAWAEDMTHVKFGRIKGMSTRKGTAILLSDLLDEAHIRMKSKQLTSPTTKIDVEANPHVTDTLATTAVIIHDLKQRRQRDYTFHWDDALQDKGDTGVRLQYTHSRLCSLEQMCGVALPDNLNLLNTSLIQEPELICLIKDLARFRQVLQESHEQLEPCILVRYLFDLSHSIGVALKFLPVKNQAQEVAQVRLAAFTASKRVLSLGLKILGVRPLDAM